jgi:hypothetical protein
MKPDYDKYLDSELFRIQMRRAIMKATSINDMVDAELLNERYKKMQRSIEEYQSKAKENIASLAL